MSDILLPEGTLSTMPSMKDGMDCVTGYDQRTAWEHIAMSLPMDTFMFMDSVKLAGEDGWEMVSAMPTGQMPISNVVDPKTRQPQMIAVQYCVFKRPKLKNPPPDKFKLDRPKKSS